MNGRSGERWASGAVAVHGRTVPIPSHAKSSSCASRCVGRSGANRAICLSGPPPDQVASYCRLYAVFAASWLAANIAATRRRTRV